MRVIEPLVPLARSGITTKPTKKNSPIYLGNGVAKTRNPIKNGSDVGESFKVDALARTPG